MQALEAQAEANAASFNAQNVANTLWAYATMSRKPGERLMNALEERAQAVAASFTTQEVSNTLWAYAVVGRQPGWADAGARGACGSQRCLFQRAGCR